jgi:hypothetical protein
MALKRVLPLFLAMRFLGPTELIIAEESSKMILLDQERTKVPILICLTRHHP